MKADGRRIGDAATRKLGNAETRGRGDAGDSEIGDPADAGNVFSKERRSITRPRVAHSPRRRVPFPRPVRLHPSSFILHPYSLFLIPFEAGPEHVE